VYWGSEFSRSTVRTERPYERRHAPEILSVLREMGRRIPAAGPQVVMKPDYVSLEAVEISVIMSGRQVVRLRFTAPSQSLCQ